mmetsp:Transcript_27691/g.56852  ORF Transcript_27691/g.56852 Transcript_27691/m.56852 type:complete len:216 (+) Transcript_27691:878-1525(+)
MATVESSLLLSTILEASKRNFSPGCKNALSIPAPVSLPSADPDALFGALNLLAALCTDFDLASSLPPNGSGTFEGSGNSGEESTSSGSAHSRTYAHSALSDLLSGLLVLTKEAGRVSSKASGLSDMWRFGVTARCAVWSIWFSLMMWMERPLHLGSCSVSCRKIKNMERTRESRASADRSAPTTLPRQMAVSYTGAAGLLSSAATLSKCTGSPQK